MGFGRGIDSEARRGAVLQDEGRWWRVTVAAVEVEERVPTDHMRHNSLSPHESPFVGSGARPPRAEGSAFASS